MIGTTVWTYPPPDAEAYKKSKEMWTEAATKELPKAPSKGLFTSREKYSNELLNWRLQQSSDRDMDLLGVQMMQITEKYLHEAKRVPAVVVAADSEGVMVVMDGKPYSRKIDEFELQPPVSQSKTPA